MRAIVLALLCAVPAWAEPVPFWDEVAHPHGRRAEALAGEARELVERALALRQSERATRRRLLFERALERYEQAVRLVPGDAALVLELAGTAAEAGDHLRADAAFRKWQELAPEAADVEALVRWSRSLIRLGRADAAEALLVRGIAEASGSDRAHLLLLAGYALMTQGRLEDAALAFTRASAAVQSGSDAQIEACAHMGLAIAYDRDEQLGKASDALDQVRRADPSMLAPLAPASAGGLVPFHPPADLHYWRAVTYQALGRREEAILEWRAYLASPEPRFRRRAAHHLAAAEAAPRKRPARRSP